jgi:inhibitor of KinA
VTPSFAPAGDQGLVIQLGDGVLPESVMAAVERLEGDRPAGVIDVVPGYASVLVIHEPTRADEVRRWAAERLRVPGSAASAPGREVEIPVLYDPAVALDLQPLAAEKRMTVEAVVRLHTSVAYRCHLLGFRPGFPFLGGLDPALWSARLATPRLRVPAGSVAIGGRQTGIYPVDSPGGWRIIGRTPLRLFDLDRADPFLIHPGDRVRFVAVGEDRFQAIGASSRTGASG